MRRPWSIARALALTTLGITMSGAAGAANIRATIDPLFALTGRGDQPFTSRDVHGRFLLIYFGYTRCPDQCPLTMATIAAAMRLLGPRAARVQPVFITIDPRRDTVRLVDAYVRLFGNRFIGLTGSVKAITKAESAFHVYVETNNPNPGQISHGSLLYVVGPSGRLRTALSGELTAQQLALALSTMIGAAASPDQVH